MGTYKTVKVKRNGKTVTKRMYVPSSKSSSSKSSSSSSKSSSSSSSKSSSSIDYTFDPRKETASEYNARIAAARGDSAESLASMQAATQKAFSGGGSSINYNYDAANETAEQYNQRIAAARGDSPESLANMQSLTQQAFADVGLNYQALPTTTAPTNVGEIQPFVPTTLPEVSPYVPGITNATAGMAGLSDYVTSQQAAIEREAQRRLAAEQENQKQTQSLIDRLLGNIRTPDEARTQAIRETGIDPEEYFAEQRAGIKEIEKLTEEYNAVKAARDQQIAQTQDKMASMSFINNQQAQIERNAAPRLNEISANINAKAATLEALQGNYAQARQYINEAVAAATADAKFKFDMFSTFYSLNQDAFERTESIYRDAFEQSMNAAENDYNRQYDEKMQIGELMLKYPGAGIAMGDSIEEAFRKAQTVAGTSAPDLTADMKNFLFAQENPAFAEFMNKNGAGVTANYTDIMQQSIDAGATPEQAAREAATASELQGIPVDQKTLSAWTTYARSLQKTPTQPEPEATISAPSGTYRSTSGEQGITLLGIWDSLFGD